MSETNAERSRIKRKQTILIVLVSLFIVFAVAIAMIPLALNMLGTGVKTDGIDTTALREGTTDVDGEWTVSNRPGPNRTSVGFTFDEVLPGERRSTSGSTHGVTGAVSIAGGTMTAGEITVSMETVTTDSDVRDSHTRETIFHTEQFPEATFTLTQPADFSQVPGNGTPGAVELSGDLTIHGETNAITHTFDAVLSGDQLIVAGDVPINRVDYGVVTPELVAAKIEEEGEINIRLNLSKN